MGTWSTDAFGNDQACDWAQSLAETEDLSAVEAALAALDAYAKRRVDAGAAVHALAAIEVIARLRGHAGYRNAYTQLLDEWVLRTRLTPPDPLVQRASTVLERILGDDSELKALWFETADGPAWSESVQALRSRLLAPPVPLAPDPPDRAAPAGDDRVARLTQGISAIHFAVPDLPRGAQVGALYSAVAAADALCDLHRVRETIARAWLPLAQLEKVSVAWDLAVREAKTWALEGQLEEALAGLEAWRGSAAAAGAGQFDIRAAGVCVSGGDLDRARQLRQQACAAAPESTLWRLDEALLEARLGSTQLARDILDRHVAAFDTDKLKPVVSFILGIVACREKDPSALGLLTRATEEYLEKCETGSAASWSIFSISCGWLAMALDQAGRCDDARALVLAAQTILLQPYNLELLAGLKDRGLLPATVEMPRWPLASQRASRYRAAGQNLSDHGVFKTVSARGVNTLMQVETLRRDYARGSRAYPFLIGDERDLETLLRSLTPPTDGGAAALEQARALDPTAWLGQRVRKRKPRWPKDGPGPVRTVLSQFEGMDQILKPVMFIGLVELDEPWELFARIGYGDWNECPPPSVHGALHRHWGERFGAEPIAICNDVVECVVARSTHDRPTAIALACEHEVYCPDVIEQGIGTVAKRASTLLGTAHWYFWWD